MDPKDPDDLFHVQHLLLDTEGKSEALRELKRLRRDAGEWQRMREHAGPVRSMQVEPGLREVNVTVDPSGDLEALADSSQSLLDVQYRGHEVLLSLEGSLESIADHAAELPLIREHTGRMVSQLGGLQFQGWLQLAVAARSAYDLAELRWAFEDFAEDFGNFADDALEAMHQTREAIEYGFAGTQALMLALADRHEALADRRVQFVAEGLHRASLAITGEIAASSLRVTQRLDELVKAAFNPARTQADELVRAAHVDLACGNVAGALTLARRAIEIYPVHPEAWLLAGSIRWKYDLHQTDAGDAFTRAYHCALHLREAPAFESATLALAAWHAAVGLDDLQVLEDALAAWGDADEIVKQLPRVFLERSAVSLDRWLESGAAPKNWPDVENFTSRISWYGGLWREALADHRLRTLFHGTLRVERDEHNEIVDVDEHWGAVDYLWAGTQRSTLETVYKFLDVLKGNDGEFGGPQVVAELWMMLMRIRNSMSFLASTRGDTWFLDLPDHLKDVFEEIRCAVRAPRLRLRRERWLMVGALHEDLGKIDPLLPQHPITSRPLVMPDWPAWKWEAWRGPSRKT